MDALLKTHIRLGDDAQETRNMLDKHRKFVEVAQVNSNVQSKEIIINYLKNIYIYIYSYPEEGVDCRI